MATGHVVTRVARVTGKASGATSDGPTTPDTLPVLTARIVVEHAAETLSEDRSADYPGLRDEASKPSHRDRWLASFDNLERVLAK
jgi:hypothetical protein